MRLSDVKRLAVKKQIRVRFTLSDGTYCIVNEHGVGTVPDLQGPPGFDLEEEFGRATEFSVESANVEKGRDARKQMTVVRREQLEQMTGAEGGSTVAVPEHEE